MILKTWKAIDVALSELEDRAGLPDFVSKVDEVEKAICSLSMQTGQSIDGRMDRLKNAKECHGREEESRKRKSADEAAHHTLPAQEAARDRYRQIIDAIRMALIAKDIATADRLLDELIIDYPHEEMAGKLREARDRVVAGIKDEDRENVKKLLPVNNLIAIASSEGAPQIVVSWTSEGSGLATEYKVLRKNLKGNGTRLFICADPPFTDTKITLDVPYRYTIIPCFRGVSADHVALETDDVVATDSSGTSLPVDDQIDGLSEAPFLAKLVLCPVCGWHNLINETFRCRVCGKDYLCRKHFSEAEKCCEDCALKMSPNRSETKDETLISQKLVVSAGDVKTLVLPSGITMEMIYCAPGEFIMGSQKGYSNEVPVHRVRLKHGFWLGKYEVTQLQWTSVMGYNPSYFMGDDRRPVEQVSWHDCQKFIRRIDAEVRLQFHGFKTNLPTEAQWEYACRAGTSKEFAGNIFSMAWYWDHARGVSHESTYPVGLKSPNAWGFYDMHGNVHEWCADAYGDGYYKKCHTDDPFCEIGYGHVIRGGSWRSSSRLCRSACRTEGEILGKDCEHGFRLCCSSVKRNVELSK